MPNNGTIRLEKARKFIRDRWLELSDAELAQELGLNIVSVRRLRYRLGLIRGKSPVDADRETDVEISGVEGVIRRSLK